MLLIRPLRKGCTPSDGEEGEGAGGMDKDSGKLVGDLKTEPDECGPPRLFGPTQNYRTIYITGLPPSWSYI